MKTVKIVAELVGLLLLIPTVALATMRYENRNNDGPSIIFPGDELMVYVMRVSRCTLLKSQSWML